MKLFRTQFEYLEDVFFVTSRLGVLERIGSTVYLKAKHLEQAHVGRFQGNPSSLVLKQFFPKCPYKFLSPVMCWRRLTWCMLCCI